MNRTVAPIAALINKTTTEGNLVESTAQSDRQVNFRNTQDTVHRSFQDDRTFLIFFLFPPFSFNP